ncbi:MAG: alpha/beta hydrolase, partial [Shimia sp.]
MPDPEMLDTADGRRLAYHRTRGTGPTVVFLGGFASDMTGTKATHLEGWARRRGRAFLRFDYSGHGASSGAFEDGCIGDWLADA